MNLEKAGFPGNHGGLWTDLCLRGSQRDSDGMGSRGRNLAFHNHVIRLAGFLDEGAGRWDVCVTVLHL